MVRYRKVNKYGLRFVVELMKSDMIDLGWNVGDYIDIEDCVIKVVKKKNKK